VISIVEAAKKKGNRSDSVVVCGLPAERRCTLEFNITLHIESLPLTRMASNHDVFEEHVGVIAALRENYSGTDDGMMIQAIHDVYDHIKDLRIQREGHVKDIIRGMWLVGLCCWLLCESAEFKVMVIVELTQHVERDEAEAKYPREEGEHEREMEDLRREKEGAQKEVGSLEAQMEALETQKKDVERQMEALDCVWKKLVAMEKVEEPYQRCAI